MQAEDMWLLQSTNPRLCPLCNTPLNNGGTHQSHYTMVSCPSCGYSAPFVQRQPPGDSSTGSPGRGQVTPTALASRPSAGSSVWIDPAVSAFLEGDVIDAGNVYSQRERLSPLPHRPKKPQPNPVTPIPPVAPAIQPTNSVKVRPKYSRSHTQLIRDDDVTRIPTMPPPTLWQYESPDFEAESSLSALSLVVDVPTQPEALISPKSTGPLSLYSDIDKIDTVPAKSAQTSIDEIDTIPSFSAGHGLTATNEPSILALAPVSPQALSTRGADRFGDKRPQSAGETNDPSSWTAGGAAESVYAQRIAGRGRRRNRKHSFNLLDRLRWWLLHPGRIEFILWLGGTMLLLCVTFVLLLVTAVSLSWITPGLLLQHENVPGGLLKGSSPGAGSSPTGQRTITTTSGLSVTLLDKGSLVVGMPVHLRGQGFSSRGYVTFNDEKNHPMLNLNNQLNFVQADKNGAFTATLSDAFWAPGHHLIVVHDVDTNRAVPFPVFIAAGLYSNGTPPPTTSGFTATPTQGSGGGFPTPVSSTPVPVTPTVATTPKPTPTKTKPTPTPTRGVTPTPTAAMTATAGITPTPTNKTGTQNVNGQLLAANMDSTSLHANGNFDAWLWLLVVGYCLAMLMLGLAGILRQRQR